MNWLIRKVQGWSEINPPAAPADMRDIRALRRDLSALKKRIDDCEYAINLLMHSNTKKAED